MIKWSRLIKSFKYALSGIKQVFVEEQNFKIHVLISLIVLSAALYFRIQNWELAVIILLIAFIFILEIINSITERLVDLLKPRIHQYVKDIKDLGAAIVLVGAVAAIIIGLLIFLPYILEVFNLS
jgi:undecaprenol kinase